MLKTQRDVHTMMKALDLHLPHEDGPGVGGIKFDLLKSLVKEEAKEFDASMTALRYCVDLPSGWRQKMLDVARYMGKSNEERLLRATPYDASMYWWAEVIDAVCDITVVIHNTTNAMGVDIEPFFDEVHRTNMLKADGPLREDGKRLKPPGWKPPQILEMLQDLVDNRGRDNMYELGVALQATGAFGQWETHVIKASSEEEAHRRLEEKLHEEGIPYVAVFTVWIGYSDEDEL